MPTGVMEAENSGLAPWLCDDSPWQASMMRRDGVITMSDEPPWWELTGHERHAACLIAARAGDRGALEALASDLTPLVWTVARAQGLDRTHAEDVVHVRTDHRDPREAGPVGQVHRLPEGLGRLDPHHLCARHHHLADDGVPQVEDGLQHLSLGLVHHPAVSG